MGVMSPPGPELRQPAPFGRGQRRAQRPLDRRGDEDAGNRRVLGRHAQQFGMGRRPGRTGAQPVAVQHRHRREALALLHRENARRRRTQPDVDVEPGLVRGMARAHRPAARLGDVADQDARPAEAPGRGAKPGDEGDGGGMGPVAVAAGAHHLPARTAGGQRHRPGQTAAGMGADRPGRAGRRAGDPPEQLARRRGIARGGAGRGDQRQRRQDAADCGAGHGAQPSPAIPRIAATRSLPGSASGSITEKW
ncbi:MAG: hypothetical protein KatS3mg118_0902 [Paracoccaceae bacterium]|nr:MAG: hypothetical protein KatS3mg118_0902 [Paracoccaceae bacterium]